MDGIAERLERRRSRLPREPGTNKGARRLFEIYYTPNCPAERERVVEGVARRHEQTRDPLQRAADSLGKWACGRRVPTFQWRKLLWELVAIPMEEWDEPSEGLS